MLAGRRADQDRVQRADAGGTVVEAVRRRSFCLCDMKRRGLQLSRRQRQTLYAIGLVLLLSGAPWAWIHRLDEAGQRGHVFRELKPWLLKTHGLAALGF